MSYLSIKDFIKSGEKSLRDKNYWSALFVALTLPSMCSRLQYQADDYKGKSKNDSNGYWYINNSGRKIWNDKKCYFDFCDLIMRSDAIINGVEFHNVPNGYLLSILGSKYNEVLYSLRCDILHTGTVNIFDDNKSIYLMLGENCQATELLHYKTIPIKELCEIIFQHISVWYSNSMKKNITHTPIFDMEHSNDDKLLFRRLCEEARSEDLKEKFEKDDIERREEYVKNNSTRHNN